jgi:ferrous iron transport protein B
MTIALAGNPNSGKTTLFNNLTGSNQFVGNWPGVTVEKKTGKLKTDSSVSVTDLPGIYSLSPYTSEEVIARNYLLRDKPDAILNIIDGTNIERNLYLSTQLAELDIPMVLAVNMLDILEKRGVELDVAKFGEILGHPAVTISALKGTNTAHAAELAAELPLIVSDAPPKFVRFDSAAERTLGVIEALLPDSSEHRRFDAVKLFERDALVKARYPDIDHSAIERLIADTEAQLDDDSESIIANGRYTYIERIVKQFLNKRESTRKTPTELIDRFVMNRVLALPIFAAVIFVVYAIAVSTLGGFITDWTNETLFGEVIPGAVSGWLKSAGAAEWQRGLIIDGIIGGVGAVLGFVPQMLILFFMLAFLEGCGYMARIAYLLDSIFHRFGLSGKSFIPFLIGTGCGVPGIMASRTIESDSERRVTIMTTTFMPCGAKLPVIALFAGAALGGGSWVMASSYLLGIASILLSGIILQQFKWFRRHSTPFIMELPNYHMPTLSALLRETWHNGWSFIKKAGTIILISSVAVWFLSNFGFVNGRFQMVSDLRFGLLATVGRMLSWLFIPLGFGTWQATVSVFTGLIAKENIVATLGVIYGGGSGISAAFTPVIAYAFLVFNLLCMPCMAAVGAIRREMNNARWFWIAIAYQCSFAYIVALVVRLIGSLIFGG